MSTQINPTVCDGCGKTKPTEWPAYRGWASISKSCAQGDDDPIDDLCPTCYSKVEALFGKAVKPTDKPDHDKREPTQDRDKRGLW